MWGGEEAKGLPELLICVMVFVGTSSAGICVVRAIVEVHSCKQHGHGCVDTEADSLQQRPKSPCYNDEC